MTKTSNQIDSPIKVIQSRIQPLREEIINHPLYSSIQTVDDLKIFMKHHVFAVWDFMSLLKSLQMNLTCTSLPWVPVGNADTRFLINEIVVGEESDVDQNGVRMSHFELYLEAMNQIGADTSQINHFISCIKKHQSFKDAFIEAEVPTSVREFVNFTFEVANSNQPHIQAAVFTFGREDLIPGMFVSMVDDIYKHIPSSISTFKYYLERHIEIDGDHHSNLALEMTSNLCRNNDSYWGDAIKFTEISLMKRKMLWDGAYQEIIKSK